MLGRVRDIVRVCLCEVMSNRQSSGADLSPEERRLIALQFRKNRAAQSQAEPNRQGVGSAAGWSPLIPIQERGSGRPCFFVHTIGGLVIAYVELARLIGEEQRFYALQAAGLEADQVPISDIPTMARCYLDAIRAVQPHGPYVLGGWSFGGLVVHEMVLQLQAAGEVVDLLVLIEPSPPCNEQPAEVVDDASYWVWRYREHTDLSAEDLRRFPSAEQPFVLLQRMQDEGRMPGYYLKRIDVLSASRVFLVEKHNHAASWRYRPSSWSAAVQKIVLIHADEWIVGHEHDMLLLWGPLLQGSIAVHAVPGNHHTVLSHPNIVRVAHIVRDALAWVGREAQG